MIVSLIQTGDHNGEKVLIYDITKELDTCGTITVRVKPEYYDKFKGLETVIKKHLEK
jgi:hypothetical protein